MEHTILSDTRILIDLDRIAGNMRAVKNMAGPQVTVAAVVKADAYGHGAAAIAPTLMENGAGLLAVANLAEALELKKAYPQYPVFIMGLTPDRLLPLVVEYGIIQTVDTLHQAQVLSRLAGEQKKTAVIHIKYDTGFHRLGFPAVPKSLEEIRRLYESLFCVKNERGESELAFTEEEAAVEFALGALENTRMYAADEDRYCMQYLADLLKKSLEWGVLQPESLYGTEEQVIGLLQADERSGRLWEEYRKLSHVRTVRRKPEGCYSVRVPSKLRWIDPLFQQDGSGPVRISNVSREVKEEIEGLRRLDFDGWIYAPEGAEAAALFLQNL